MILLLILFLSICVSFEYWLKLRQAIQEFPKIVSLSTAEKNFSSLDQFPKVSVIIPAYNEAENIEDCVKTILLNTALPPEKFEVWVVDDQSSDRTLAILQMLQQQGDPRLHVIAGSSRPQDRLWLGKSWACQQAANQANGEYLIFIDADVRVKPEAISLIVKTALDQKVDFITCVPQIVSGSLVEWLVQPLMYINVLVSFNSEVVKNPKTRTAYALGPFLMFHASAYHQVGTHQGVSDQIAEDVAFARRIKSQGFYSRSILAPNLLSLRMYRNWQMLWEGWTKNLYVGAQRNVGLMLMLAFVMLTIYTIPWLGLGIALFQTMQTPGLLPQITIGLAALAILLQYRIRNQGSKALGTLSTYWWLQGISGILIASLAIASVVKAETGWGWTWRGRRLSAAKKAG